jgi:glycosyltransferase involved in cell wall biosynthesis
MPLTLPAALLAALPRLGTRIGDGVGTLAAAIRADAPDVETEAVDPFSEPIAPLDAVAFGPLPAGTDPVRLVAHWAKHTTPEAALLFALPNPRHGPALVEVLRGGSPPTAWTTAAALEAACRASGFAGLEWRADPLGDDLGLAKALKPLLDGLNIPHGWFHTEARAGWRVLRATRRPRPRRLLQSMTIAPIGAINDVRVIEPASLVQTVPGWRSIISEKTIDLGIAAADEAKVLLWQRPVMRRQSEVSSLRTLIQRGYLIVTEFDDHPMRWPDIEGNGYLSFTGVHAVQTSTPELAELFRTYDPEVRAFPNAILHLPPPPAPRQRKEVVLFFGALNREDDWRPLMPALNATLAELGSAVVVDVLHDRVFFDALTTPSKRFTPLAPAAEYRRHLADADVAFLPLADTLFNRMKSDLKYIEAAAHGAVALASPTVYRGSIKSGEDGILFQDAGEMAEGLRRLVDDPGLRHRLSMAAWTKIRRERLAIHQTAARAAWYEDLLARRDQLTAGIRTRVPELAG